MHSSRSRVLAFPSASREREEGKTEDTEFSSFWRERGARQWHMRKVNLKDVEEQERKSPKGNFHKFVKDVSIALGRDPDSLDLAKRHPFDLAMVRIPKGKSYCPYHSHGAESELYLVVSGRGSVRDKSGKTEVSAGDSFFFGPGEAHQTAKAR